MVKPQKKHSSDNRENQGASGCLTQPSKIGPAAASGLCSERLSLFGGLIKIKGSPFRRLRVNR